MKESENPYQRSISYSHRPVTGPESRSLFDPNLLVALEQAVKENMRMSEAERQARIEQEKLEQSGVQCKNRKSRRAHALHAMRMVRLIVYPYCCQKGYRKKVILCSDFILDIWNY
ncbi:hypothetical protein SLA2020_235560 [Shorea laevis]